MAQDEENNNAGSEVYGPEVVITAGKPDPLPQKLPLLPTTDNPWEISKYMSAVPQDKTRTPLTTSSIPPAPAYLNAIIAANHVRVLGLKTDNYNLPEYKLWRAQKSYKDFGYTLYPDYRTRFVNGYYIASNVVDAWYTEEFKIYDWTLKDWLPYTPTGYISPARLMKGYAGMDELADAMESILETIVFTMLTGGLTRTTVLGTRLLAEVAGKQALKLAEKEFVDTMLRFCTQVVAELVKEGGLEALKTGDWKNVDLADVLTSSVDAGFKNHKLGRILMPLFKSFIQATINVKLVDVLEGSVQNQNEEPTGDEIKLGLIMFANTLRQIAINNTKVNTGNKYADIIIRTFLDGQLSALTKAVEANYSK